MEKSIPVLKKYYNKMPWLHAHPYFWPESSSAPLKNTNPWVMIHWHMNVYLTIGYFGFVVYRTTQVFQDPKQTLDLKLYLLLVSAYYALGALFHSRNLVKSNVFIQFQRSHIKFVADGKPWIGG